MLEKEGEHKETIVLFGETNFRDKRVKFGIKPDDRRRHMYVIGKTGVGKTTLIENMLVQDIAFGHGVCLIDPHGEFADRMLDFIPPERINDVVYFNPSDIDFPVAFNAIEQVPVEYRHLVASGLMAVFKKIWVDLWSARMEYILNNTLLALLEVPDSTLLGVNRMLADQEYRRQIVDMVTDPVVKAFWLTEFARYDARFRAEAVAPIQNKVGQFVSNPLIRNIIGQKHSKLNLREVMDEGKILIVNLSKGLMGEENSALLGAMLVTKLQLAAMSRVDMPEAERKDFYLYVDEFQNYATESFANILSEARKYRLDLTLVHQYLAQLPEEGVGSVRSAIFGNVGTIVTFRVGAEDAEFLEQEFAPEFSANDLLNLPKWNFYIKLMIDGTASKAFSGANLPPPVRPDISHRDEIIKLTRDHYATPRKDVEEAIRTWSGEVTAEPERLTIESGMTRAPMQAVARPLWDAVCVTCQKPTKVPFQPDGKRPIYCKDCLKARRDLEAAGTGKVGAGAEVRREPRPISLKEAMLREEQGEHPERPRLAPKPVEKKGPDIEGLRAVLKDVLEDKGE